MKLIKKNKSMIRIKMKVSVSQSQISKIKVMKATLKVAMMKRTQMMMIAVQKMNSVRKVFHLMNLRKGQRWRIVREIEGRCNGRGKRKSQRERNDHL